MTPYLQFNRHQWAALRDSVPMTLTEEEITRLKGINEDLSLEEVAEIYLPLSRLLNFYISSNLRRQAVLEQFLGTNGQRIPYIISIAGSVAVGKSTTARVLQALLSRWPEHRHGRLPNFSLSASTAARFIDASSRMAVCGQPPVSTPTILSGSSAPASVRMR